MGTFLHLKKWFKEKTNKKGSIHHRKASSYQMETKFRFFIKKKKRKIIKENRNVTFEWELYKVDKEVV